VSGFIFLEGSHALQLKTRGHQHPCQAPMYTEHKKYIFWLLLPHNFWLLLPQEDGLMKMNDRST